MTLTDDHFVPGSAMLQKWPIVSSRNIIGYRLLILDGHESHHSTDFELYCKDKNTISICMPPHSSHILQPLDIGCFSPLKQAYGRQIEDLMRASTIHFTKDFFPAFFRGIPSFHGGKERPTGFSRGRARSIWPGKCYIWLDVKPRTPTPEGRVPGGTGPLGFQDA